MKLDEQTLQSDGGNTMAAKVKLGHIAIPAQNPKELATFYADFLGLGATLDGMIPNLGDFVFLSDNPHEHLQTLALITRPEARHIAWEAESLAALKSLYANAKSRGLQIFALNHRVTLSLYMRDPEGNSIELFWPTGKTSSGLFAEPFDLSNLDKSDSAIKEILNPAQI